MDTLAPPRFTRGATLATARRRLAAAPGADAELGEHLAQVPLDRSGADEQLGGDLRIGQAVAGQPRDLRLLGRELLARLSTVRLRTVAPVASSSRRARSANASMPIEVNIS